MLSAGQVVMDFIRRLQSCLTHSWKALWHRGGTTDDGRQHGPSGDRGRHGRHVQR